MALKSGLQKFNEDKNKLKNQSQSQAISPLTEQVLNNNNNPDSLKMVGTNAAKQGTMNQLGKDQQAVQNGAMAQQQQDMQQQRQLQDQGQSLADFQSEGVEKAQEAANQKAEQWSKSMAQFGSLGQRVSTAVQEELAAGGELAQQFEANEEMLQNATSSLATPGQEAPAREVMNTVLSSLQAGDSSAAIAVLADPSNAALFNVDTTNAGAALTQIFSALNIDPSQQQQMVSSALADGVVDAENLTMDFLLSQGILTTDNAQIPELGLTVAEIEEMVGPEWRNLTVDQIESELSLTIDDQAEKDDILRELANPNIDPTRKAELQRELQLIDASGAGESEAMAARALDRVGAADQITMGDQLVNVEDVLNDEAIKAASNDLMMRLQEDPEMADQILADWKAKNPGYEQMGDWVSGSIQELKEKGEEFEDASEIVEAKQKESAKFINNNELFGADQGSKQILEELGFNTEGFGAMGNDPANNPTYQALSQFKENSPDQFALFQQNLVNMDQEDIEGLRGAENLTPEEQTARINAIMQTLGTKKGMEDFNYLRELNNKLNILSTDTNDFTEVMSSILPEGHPLNDITSKPEAAQKYLSDLRKLNELGVMTPELEAFSELMDQDGDGVIDSSSEIAQKIKGLVGDGVNIGNFQESDAQELLGIMNQEVANINEIATKQMKNWADTKGVELSQTIETASTSNNDIESKNPWIKDGKINNSYSNHPSRGKWKQAFNPGKLGPGTAQKQGARIFEALNKNPNLFDSMPEFTGGASKELIKWVSDNIGLDPYSQNKDTGSSQVGNMMRNILRAGGGTVTAGGVSGGDIKKGIEALFGNDVRKSKQLQEQYASNTNKINSAKNTKNPWSDLV